MAETWIQECMRRQHEPARPDADAYRAQMAARERSMDPVITWAVVPHCEAKIPTGRGYVARSLSNGQTNDFYNYGGINIA